MTVEELTAVKSLMRLIREEKNSSVTNLTTLYEGYRALVLRKGQHVHPMLYEDLGQQFNRLKLEILPRLERSIVLLKEEKLGLEGEIT